jgi:hypothetical protein
VLTNQTVVEADKLGMSPRLAQYAIGSTIEETRMNLMELQNVLQEQIQIEVNKRLNGKDIKDIKATDVNTDPFIKGFSKGGW